MLSVNARKEANSNLLSIKWVGKSLSRLCQNRLEEAESREGDPDLVLTLRASRSPCLQEKMFECSVTPGTRRRIAGKRSRRSTIVPLHPPAPAPALLPLHLTRRRRRKTRSERKKNRGDWRKPRSTRRRTNLLQIPSLATKSKRPLTRMRTQRPYTKKLSFRSKKLYKTNTLHSSRMKWKRTKPVDRRIRRKPLQSSRKKSKRSSKRRLTSTNRSELSKLSLLIERQQMLRLPRQRKHCKRPQSRPRKHERRFPNWQTRQRRRPRPMSTRLRRMQRNQFKTPKLKLPSDWTRRKIWNHQRRLKLNWWPSQPNVACSLRSERR